MTCHIPRMSTKKSSYGSVIGHWKNQSPWDHFYVGAFVGEESWPNASQTTRILINLLTTALTSATVTGANSSLRYIKTDFHNSMTEDRFNALILMHVHKDIKLDREKLLIDRQQTIQNECCCKTLWSLKFSKLKLIIYFWKFQFYFLLFSE